MSTQPGTVHTFESGQYSVPHQPLGKSLLGATVWARALGVGDGEQVIIVAVEAGSDGRGPVETARHRRATPGTPQINDEQFPPQPEDPLNRRLRAKSPAEAEFLDLGEGARLWLIEAAIADTPRMRVKMTDALAPAELLDPVEVDWALGHAAVHGRFAEADLASILDHHARAAKSGERRASEDSSLIQGTSAWARLGHQSGTGEADRMNTASAPPLPAHLRNLLRRLRLPHIRRHAPEVVATAEAQCS